MQQYKSFRDIPMFTRSAPYGVTIDWEHIEKWIGGQSDQGQRMEIEPDFQRGRVWTDEQQVRYIEFCLRGGSSGRDILWNHPTYMHGDLFAGTLQLVDGLQRLTAVRLFMSNKLRAFGAFYDEFSDARRMSRQRHFNMRVNDLATRAEVLTWYLELNDGGTPHTREEIDRVKALLHEETLRGMVA